MRNEWEMLDSFDIDNGELAGLTLVQAFVLGAEYMDIRTKAMAGDPFEAYIQAQNAQRISLMLNRHDMICEYVYDADIGWTHLRAVPK